MTINEAIKKVIEHENLTADEAESVLEQIMTGDATELQIAALLTALRMKGETVAEVPLTVLESVEESGIFGRAWDALRLWIQ